MPRARPEPRAAPNVPNGAGASAGTRAADEAGAERGSLGAAAGAPVDAVSDMVCVCFVTRALNARREQPGWLMRQAERGKRALRMHQGITVASFASRGNC